MAAYISRLGPSYRRSQSLKAYGYYGGVLLKRGMGKQRGILRIFFGFSWRQILSWDLSPTKPKLDFFYKR